MDKEKLSKCDLSTRAVHAAYVANEYGALQLPYIRLQPSYLIQPSRAEEDLPWKKKDISIPGLETLNMYSG